MWTKKDDADEEPDWVQEERNQFSSFRDRNNDGFMDRDEVKDWIIPDDYDHAESEAKHLIHEADANQVSDTTYHSADCTNFRFPISLYQTVTSTLYIQTPPKDTSTRDSVLSDFNISHQQHATYWCNTVNSCCREISKICTHKIRKVDITF